MSAPRISAEEFRKRYLGSLRQQISNDNKNLQANQLFKQTAQPSQIEDNRTITEKFADEERLTSILIAELSKITDQGSANDIVRSLTFPDKQFLLEQYGAISEELKRRFKFGFTRAIFKPFFEKFAEAFLETGGVASTPQQIAETIQESREQEAEEAPFGVARAGAEGTYESKLPPFEFRGLEPAEWRSLRGRIVKELKRQIKDENISGDQKQRRRFILSFIDGNEALGGKSKTYPNFRDFFATDRGMETLEEINQFLGAVSGRGIRGRGLSRTKSAPILKEGIGKTERFAKFGRYMIDKQKLKDGQCVIRFTSGACIHKIPARRVGKEVQNVLGKIAGGQLPNFEDINALSQDDRRYLYNIQKQAKMEGGIPSPDKDAEQKEMEEFEKMRGQILAGNDNKELVKKFKMTLLKYAKDGRLPRREVNEILVEMASIGL